MSASVTHGDSATRKGNRSRIVPLFHNYTNQPPSSLMDVDALLAGITALAVALITLSLDIMHLYRPACLSLTATFTPVTDLGPSTTDLVNDDSGIVSFTLQLRTVGGLLEILKLSDT